VPTNVLFNISVYGNVDKVSIPAERNLPLWNYDLSWQKRVFGAGRARAQD
jgi:hypothetical protein